MASTTETHFCRLRCLCMAKHANRKNDTITDLSFRDPAQDKMGIHFMMNFGMC